MVARKGVTLAVATAQGLNFRSVDPNITYPHQIRHLYPTRLGPTALNSHNSLGTFTVFITIAIIY